MQPESNIVLINDSMQRFTLKQNQTDFSKETERFGYSSSAWLQLVGLRDPHLNIQYLSLFKPEKCTVWYQTSAKQWSINRLRQARVSTRLCSYTSKGNRLKAKTEDRTHRSQRLEAPLNEAVSAFFNASTS